MTIIDLNRGRLPRTKGMGKKEEVCIAGALAPKRGPTKWGGLPQYILLPFIITSRQCKCLPDTPWSQSRRGERQKPWHPQEQ